MKRGMTAVCCAALIAAGAGTAFAQQPASAAPAADDTDDIVVTARKREETLQEVPLAISAFTGAELQSKGVASLADIGRFTPGLNTSISSTAQSVVQFNLRGQSSGDVLMTVDPAVGLYVDGVYVSRSRGLGAGFLDLERVEVLKGPQGTLYGRNTTGGAISVVTKGADFNGMHGFVTVQGGQFDLRGIEGAVNIPLVDDKLGVRLAGQRLLRNGFGRSINSGQDLGQDRNQLSLRASVLFRPVETLSFELKASLFRSRENNALWTPRYIIPTGTAVTEAAIERSGITNQADPRFAAARAEALAYLQGLAARAANDFDTSFIDTVERDDNDVRSIGLTTSWDASDHVNLKSITAYRFYDAYSIFDFDGTNIDAAVTGVGSPGGTPIATGKPGSLSGNFTVPLPANHRNHFFSQEFNLGGDALDGRLNWLLGAFYNNERGQDIQQARTQPALTTFIFINDGYRVTTRNWAIFTQNDFRITDQLSVTAGLRYTEDRKGLVSRLANFFPATGLYQCTTGVTVPGGTAALTTSDRANCQTSQSKKFTGTSYLGSINYQLNPDILVYLRTARGFRSGTFQLRSPQLPPANPETATDYEIGLKTDLFDRVVRFNVAAFRTKYADKQESTVFTTPTGALATIIQNAADAKLKGFEAELRIRPVAGLTLNGTVSHLRGRYSSYLAAIPVQGGAAVNASGERFATPPWNYTLSGRYEAPVGFGSIGVQADWSWSAGARPTARSVNQNIPKALVESIVSAQYGGTYTNGGASLGLMNGRIDVHIEKWDLTAALFATNLLNHRYQFNGTDASAAGGIYATLSGAPRMWGISLKKGFGGE